MLTITRDAESWDVPERLPVLPLRDLVVFPYMVVPLLVGRTASLAAIEEAGRNDGWLFLVAQRSADVQEPGAADLFRVGVVSRLVQTTRLPNGTIKVLVEGVARARASRFSTAEGHHRVSLAPLPLQPGDDASAPAVERRTDELFEEYVALHRRLPAEVLSVTREAETPDKRAFATAAHLLVRLDERQRLLESTTRTEMLARIAELLASELELLRLERKIEDDVKGAIFQNQREFYLHEQLRAIHRELGQEEADDFDELEAAIGRKGFPDPVKARAERELRKLRRTPSLSPEAAVARNYLDWLVALPWTERSDDAIDVARAREVLDEDHHGLEEVKDRILDYIAVLGRVGTLEGPILCLVGPPGVGKTSLGRSVARALGRRFVRMSLGGVRDEAEIRGHRRTYIGAMPGRVLQAMRRAEVINPVLLLDEVDKLGQDWRGDPAAALLEVLDPEQNRAFNDHYLEVDYDLSSVLFVTTANSLANIPDALRDRMEIIRLPGYLDHEKHAIARRFLIPKQLRLHGIDPATVTWDDATVPAIVRGWTREAGVRELERRISRIARKLARTRAERGAEPVDERVEPADLATLLGTSPFDEDDVTLDDKVGVASGLAYTAVGGEVLEIEVSVVPGRGKLQLTGALGDVMKESATAAISYARARAKPLGLEPDFHRTRDLHIHIPSGATPKDGPSAGIAIASAVVSALTGIPVRGSVAMTGEITLRGRVLPIGGLKEKSVAALRTGIREVVIPRGNARELPELPDEVRRAVRFHVVSSMDEVLAHALAPMAAMPGVHASQTAH
ncbi:MAG: endopeptidase La [Gemmatimonadaceae bacterium]